MNVESLITLVATLVGMAAIAGGNGVALWRLFMRIEHLEWEMQRIHEEMKRQNGKHG